MLFDHHPSQSKGHVVEYHPILNQSESEHDQSGVYKEEWPRMKRWAVLRDFHEVRSISPLVSFNLLMAMDLHVCLLVNIHFHPANCDPVLYQLLPSPTCASVGLCLLEIEMQVSMPNMSPRRQLNRHHS
jgi:hypothetical protein